MKVRTTLNWPEKHNRSGMIAVLWPFEALPYYIHTYKLARKDYTYELLSS
jgi:hypothetical protein